MQWDTIHESITASLSCHTPAKTPTQESQRVHQSLQSRFVRVWHLSRSLSQVSEKLPHILAGLSNLPHHQILRSYCRACTFRHCHRHLRCRTSFSKRRRRSAVSRSHQRLPRPHERRALQACRSLLHDCQIQIRRRHATKIFLSDQLDPCGTSRCHYYESDDSKIYSYNNIW